jgi:phosphoenolpyruvate carboxykinase (ATP)
MYYNLDSIALASMSVDLGECTKLSSGALSTTTGAYTGRAPNAKAYVKDSVTEGCIDWSENNSITEEEFMKELSSFKEYKKNEVPLLFCQDVVAVRDPSHRLCVRVYTEYAKHSLFARNMFMPISELPPGSFTTGEEYTVYHFPKKEEVAKVLISLKKKIILITGTHYSGEIKKSIFSVLNFGFPKLGYLPMHCSVNVDKSRRNPAIFFGLSGTGKTTLSSDPKRILIGDDEHGWTDTGLTNFEGGCYAKTINLSKEEEPEIWTACNKSLSILENVICHNGTPDFADDSLTENTRGSYPCSNIPDADSKGFVEEHPKNIIMLTCDAFGVLPSVMKLSPSEAVEQFLMGYTAKVAGTEAGVKEPRATFSPCFGGPFMPLDPTVYAGLLRKKVEKHNTSCWLVNTGWTGGPYGVGSRIPIKTTRLIIDSILDGSLEESPAIRHTASGFMVPIHPQIPQELLLPELSWNNVDDYTLKTAELLKLFASKKNEFTT